MWFWTSVRWRIFLVAWIVYSAHFATNVVREHYPAFAVAERGTFRLDEYQGFHSDIFVHADGHSYINNQVFVSTLAAGPLWIFHPVLDALEARSKERLAIEGVTGADYRTDKPLRVAFFRLVKERGLDLRFGAATAITTVFFMAPLTALFLVCFYNLLRSRGLTDTHASELSLLLGFGTPIFFRTTGLNHNMFVMYFAFASFVLLTGGDGPRMAGWRRWLAGVAAGLTITTDYVGVVIAPVLYGFMVWTSAQRTSLGQAFRDSLAMIGGGLVGLLFLFYSQWSMFGNPFLPAQRWMPAGNVYATQGLGGMTAPQLDLLLENLFHPGFGMFVWGPLLLLALLPVRWYAESTWVLRRPERWFVVGLTISLLLFCSANQFARLQWNSGFRYLVPLVPFFVLALANHWVRLSKPVRAVLAGAVVLHSWVLTVFREPVQQSWRLFFSEGLQLPWFRVMRMTAVPGTWWAESPWIPVVILALVALVALSVWFGGARLAVRRAQAAGV
jgi:hypothetical protein